jgi:septal ring factor EnvC (AmiA/AmiB activator)
MPYYYAKVYRGSIPRTPGGRHKEITMFMVSDWVDPAELKNMVTKMKTVEDENKAMQSTLAKLEENYNALKQSIDNIREDVKPIKAKVSKL